MSLFEYILFYGKHNIGVHDAGKKKCFAWIS